VVEIFEKILAALIILALVSLLLVVAFPDINPDAIIRAVPEKVAQNAPPPKQQPKAIPVQQRVTEQPPQRVAEQPQPLMVEPPTQPLPSPPVQRTTPERSAPVQEERDVARAAPEPRYATRPTVSEERYARRPAPEPRYVRRPVPEERYTQRPESDERYVVRRERGVAPPPPSRYEAQYSERYRRPCRLTGGCVEAAPVSPQYEPCEMGDVPCPPLRKPCRPHYVQADPCEACEQRPYWADNSYRAAYGYVIQDAYAFSVECSYDE
jgi:hypothetical protein